MCWECVFGGARWPLRTADELSDSSPLHPIQFSLAPTLNRCSLGLLELNHNYLPSLNGGELVHCVIPVSPPDIKRVLWIQRGNIMSVSWIWLLRQNLRQGYGRPWAALSLCLSPFTSLIYLPLIPSSFSCSISPASLFSPLPSQKTTAAAVLMPVQG